jgi:tetratricopeptide (TPR) repeat protein
MMEKLPSKTSNFESEDLKNSLPGIAPKRTTLFSIIVILLVSFAVYSNALSNGFVYDDNLQVLNNPWIKDVRHISEIFSKSVWSFQKEPEISNYYRPLMHLIYLFNYHVFGLKPWGFHLVNILCHAGVSVLVFIIAARLISASSSSSPFGEKSFIRALLTAPFVAAVLFATHPIHTEAVAWVAALPDLSYTFFYLLSFYFYIRSELGFKGSYPFSVISFFLATLCKEPALTLPIIIVAYDFVFKRTESQQLDYVKRYIPYLFVAGIYLVLRYRALSGFAPQPPHIHLMPYQYFINAFPLFTQYLEKLLVPLKLNAFYVLHPINSFFEIKGIVSLATAVVFIGFAFVAFKKNKVVFLSLLFIIIPLLPVLYIPAVGENTFTERYLYLPSVGFVILLALFFKWTEASPKKVVISLTAAPLILAGLYLIGTLNRNTVWKDNYTLFADTVMKSPDASTPHGFLGSALLDKRRIDEAIEHFQFALQLDPLNPDYAATQNELGKAYALKGQIDEAIEHFQLALRVKSSATIHYNLGKVFILKGLLDDAIREFKTALSLKSDYADARNSLGNAYFNQNRVDKAIIEFKTALSIKPDDAVTHYNLGTAYASQNRIDEAIIECKTALSLNPDYADAHNNLGAAYFNQNRIKEAVSEFIAASKLKPDFANARHNLEICYERMKTMGVDSHK